MSEDRLIWEELLWDKHRATALLLALLYFWDGSLDGCFQNKFEMKDSEKYPTEGVQKDTNLRLHIEMKSNVLTLVAYIQNGTLHTRSK